MTNMHIASTKLVAAKFMASSMPHLVVSPADIIITTRPAAQILKIPNKNTDVSKAMKYQ